ncbi:hypothetical protein GCM10011611_49720 [Aliidongia dinghuensis]|uniref:Secretin/TonB short N-terminal domain-containing protein n=2 Tax=Aliidongia dinghuensis TaxID=1867774 RepID=A0A8J2YZZ7_9PROT|nr:hypothetical protein GCM10011611_49720 [Aliidongia dinghuensis]
MPASANPETGQAVPISFDIPAESLGDALYAFSVATGIEVVSDDALIAGKRSAAVTGKYAPEAALRRLLEPTGLAVRPVDKGAIALTLARVATFPSTPPAAPAVGDDLPDDRYGPYSAALQLAVVQALCRYDDTRPGYYRVAVRLWIGPSGAVERSALLGGTGDGKRDVSLVRLLGRLTVGEPPAGMPQPATILVMPLSPQQTGDCISAGNASLTP